jgi:hypothetical protein
MESVLINQNYTRMTVPKLKHCLTFCAFLLVTNVTAGRAQPIEAVGSRALGMGGAFVAVASDSSATWWNPAGLAAGPFLDLALARAVTESRAEPRSPNAMASAARRDTVSWFALGSPPLGISYYRLRITDIRPLRVAAGGTAEPTVTESGSRQVGTVSLTASQFGVTLVQTLVPGLHAGATLKYLRGTVRSAQADGAVSVGALLDRGDALEGGDRDSAFDLDVGLIGVAGALRAGLLVRNATEPELGDDAGVVRLDRQFRAGLAYDGRAIGAPPLVVAVDADLSTTETAWGDRRNVALGVERWVANDRLALRGGARVNTAGARERAATAGVSVAVRAGLFLDAHVVGGRREDDRGWGVAARVSF